ncbi:DEAD/DEAH box helicase [Sesbania bispinosa]|nr:DEAD/DEAH box helicase [Sesbania bispinosa]
MEEALLPKLSSENNGVGVTSSAFFQAEHHGSTNGGSDSVPILVASCVFDDGWTSW